MPSINYTDDIDMPGSSATSPFIQLKSKGEKIKFRIANTPYVRGQHWVDGKTPVACPRINRKEDCEYCQKYENGDFPPGVDEEKGRNWYQPSIQVMYPVLNRATGKSQIFQTSPSVHRTIKEAAEAGVDVSKSDLVVTRNEGAPATYYSTVRLDQSPLSPEESIAYEQAKNINFELIFSKEGKPSSMKVESSAQVKPTAKVKNTTEDKEAEEILTGNQNPDEEVAPSDIPF